MTIRCYEDDTAQINIWGLGYATNSVLTVWMIWHNPPGSGLPEFLPQPPGGALNVVVASPKKGRFVYKRTLGFCPMKKRENGSVPLVIDIAKHIDGGGVYGAVPDIPLQNITFIKNGQTFTSQGVGAGIMTVNQGVFPVCIQRKDGDKNQDPCGLND